MSNYIKNILHTFGRQLISLLLGILSSALIARYLGIENRGIYALIVLLPITIFTFLNLGINSSVIYYIGKKNDKLEDIIKSLKFLSVFIILISVFIGFIGILLFRDVFFKGISESYLLLSLLFLPALLFTNFMQAIMIGHENFKTINLILIVQPIIFISFLLLNLLLDYRIAGVLIAELFSQYIILAVTYFYVKKLYIKEKGKVSKKLIYSKLKYGLKNHFANMISFFEYRLDLLLVSFYLDLKSVGAYIIAVNIAEKIWMLASSVSSVMFARIVNAENQIEKRLITIYSAKIVFILSVIIAIILYYLSDKLIILIFGSEYRASILPFLYLLPGIVFWSAVKIYASYIAGEGKPEYNTYVSLISVTINFILNINLIPKYGLSGAAIATSIAYLANFIIRLYVFYRMSQVSLFDIVLPTKKDLTIIKSILKHV